MPPAGNSRVQRRASLTDEPVAQLIKLSFPRKWESILFENIEIIDSRFHGNDNKVVVQQTLTAADCFLI